MSFQEELKKPILIYSGTNQRAVISFCRYARSLGLSFSIVANGAEDTIFSTDFVDNVRFTRSKNELSIDTLLTVAKQAMELHGSTEILILPSTEFLNRFLLKHASILSQNRISTGLCNEETYQLISDKYAFSNHCKAKGIIVPKEYESLPTTFPFVIKAKTYGKNLKEIHEKPVLVNSEDDLRSLDRLGNLSNYYFQEYVGGKSYYLLFYFYKDSTYSVYSQENLIQQDNGASIVLAKSSRIHEEKISIDFAQLFIESDFSGLVMVEVKKYEDKFYMIEANPRFWGPSQLILDSNMSLIHDFLVDNGVISNRNNTVYCDEVYYFWSGGLLEDQRKGNTPKFYEYTMERFFEDYAELCSKDVYLKKDTIKVYVDECCRAGFSSTVQEKQ